MVNRRNTINNRLYKDDPTIFAWDLMNEPRCDCFPDFIPVPDSYVSCRPECAKKVQVSATPERNDCCSEIQACLQWLLRCIWSRLNDFCIALKTALGDTVVSVV